MDLHRLSLRAPSLALWGLWAVVAILLFPEIVSAATTFKDEMDNAKKEVSKIYVQVRNGVLLLSGIALFGCGVAALTGRMPWKWFWTLGGGIFLVAVAGILVNEMVQVTGTQLWTDPSDAIFKVTP